ncbi:hypothetical protein [Flavobacterium granuli]|uniref:Uncharacterized protein n=1 Tax=Flavobacterium granuli TaxID=280093 RepID=A0ABU1RX64_9FLAO|nr:hypothetical protein [Flavobacterium granuli]MDR6843363.1 hypothetical protein [Flavobacterium granuli]
MKFPNCIVCRREVADCRLQVEEERSKMQEERKEAAGCRRQKGEVRRRRKERRLQVAEGRREKSEEGGKKGGCRLQVAEGRRRRKEIFYFELLRLFATARVQILNGKNRGERGCFYEFIGVVEICFV